MQHDHVLKKMNFDLLTPTPGSGSWVGVLEKNICYHASAFVIPFNLMCNMTGGETQALDRKSCLICFIFIVPLFACEMSGKHIDNFLRNLNI